MAAQCSWGPSRREAGRQWPCRHTRFHNSAGQAHPASVASKVTVMEVCDVAAGKLQRGEGGAARAGRSITGRAVQLSRKHTSCTLSSQASKQPMQGIPARKRLLLRWLT